MSLPNAERIGLPNSATHRILSTLLARQRSGV